MARFVGVGTKPKKPTSALSARHARRLNVMAHVQFNVTVKRSTVDRVKAVLLHQVDGRLTLSTFTERALLYAITHPEAVKDPNA